MRLCSDRVFGVFTRILNMRRDYIFGTRVGGGWACHKYTYRKYYTSSVHVVINIVGRNAGTRSGRTGHASRADHPGTRTADSRRPSGDRGQDTGGQDRGRAEARPGPNGPRQDQPASAGPGKKAAARRRRRVGPSQHGAGRGRQGPEPDRGRRVHEG